VRLTVLHAGQEEPVELAIPRDIIHIDSVLGDTRRPDGSWDFALAGHPRITYVRLIQFGEQTVAELRTALQSRLVEALILDLRDNAGGWLDAAVGTCSFFLTSEAEIVSTRGRGGVVLHAFKADGQPLLEARVPIVVLTNHFSASASEIVAACLQDHGRAKVIGQRTWGKGTVQNILKLEGGRSALKLTTASYWRPSGQNIHRRKNAKDTDQWGVTPDAGFEVALTDEQADAVRKHRRERDLNVLGKKSVAETTDGKPAPPLADPQLDKAVDYLEQQLNTSH
jgi:carboxyl-terminal processing protease